MRLPRIAAAALLAGSLSLLPLAAPAMAAPAAPAAAAAAAKTTVRGFAAKEWGTFSTWTRSGTGDDVVALPKSIRSAIVTVHHEGDSNFAIWTLDKKNDEDDLLVNEIGAVDATVLFGLEQPGVARALEITADGAWTVTAKPVSKAPLLPKKGAGHGVYLLSSHRAARFTHDGEENFIVIQHTGGRSGWNLLVNEIGTYAGTVRLDSGPSAIEIDADGNWTAAPR